MKMRSWIGAVVGVLFLVVISTTVWAQVEWNWTGVASFEGTSYLDGKETAEGAGLKDNDLEMEHVHLKITADLSDRFSLVVAPCLTHHESVSMKLAYLEAILLQDGFETLLSAEVGRFLVPFGRFNYLGEANNYPTISRPMLYASHDQDIIIPDGFPHPVFMSELTDIGATLNGNKWFDLFGAKHQLWYAVWGGNGMYNEGSEGHAHGSADGDHGEAADISWVQEERFASDNNDDKAFGGRLSHSIGEVFSYGGSYMRGKYDPESTLDYSVAGVDASLTLGKLRFDAEYAVADTEFSAPGSAGGHPHESEYTTDGYYIQARYPLSKKWEAVAMYDVLERDGPILGEDEDEDGEHVQVLGHGAEDGITTINKIAVGVNYAVTENVTIKSELANFSFDGNGNGHDDDHDDDHGGGGDPDDVTRLSMGLVVTF